jgi:hypothetical protein
MNQTEYNRYLKATRKITSNDNDAQDLMHDVLVMLQKNIKFNNLSEKDRLFFFIRAMKNQFHSNSSHYTRTYKKYQFGETVENIELQDYIYDEEPTLDWINELLALELKNNPDFWYNKGIFELWLKNDGFIERVHKQTKIPRYSIKDTINEMKGWVKIKWKQYKDGEQTQID